MTTQKGAFTHAEILSQPEAWATALATLDEHRRDLRAFDPANRFDQLLFTGCGSPHYLSLSAAARAQALTGLPARAFPASELWLHPDCCYAHGRTLLVAISRSGETSETLRACESFLAAGRGELITVSCDPDTSLIRLGGNAVVLPSGREQSIAQTRAFTTMYLAVLALTLLWAGRDDLLAMLARLPEVGRRLIDEYGPLAAGIGADASIDRFYWLGSGPRYGLACELSLKMKEMSLSHSEPFHFLEFRHGPKSMVLPSAMVIGLRSQSQAGLEQQVLADLGALGGRTLALAETDAQVCFGSGLDEAVRDVLYLPFGQLVAYERAIARGLDPDHPTNLDAVVKLGDDL